MLLDKFSLKRTVLIFFNKYFNSINRVYNFSIQQIIQVLLLVLFNHVYINLIITYLLLRFELKFYFYIFFSSGFICTFDLLHIIYL